MSKFLKSMSIISKVLAVCTAILFFVYLGGMFYYGIDATFISGLIVCAVGVLVFLYMGKHFPDEE
jgi:hypothetical protein